MPNMQITREKGRKLKASLAFLVLPMWMRMIHSKHLGPTNHEMLPVLGIITELKAETQVSWNIVTWTIDSNCHTHEYFLFIISALQISIFRCPLQYRYNTCILNYHLYHPITAFLFSSCIWMALSNAFSNNSFIF